MFSALWHSPRCIIQPPLKPVPSSSCLSLFIPQIYSPWQSRSHKGLPSHLFDTFRVSPRVLWGLCGERASALNCTIRPKRETTHEYSYVQARAALSPCWIQGNFVQETLRGSSNTHTQGCGPKKRENECRLTRRMESRPSYIK